MYKKNSQKVLFIKFNYDILFLVAYERLLSFLHVIIVSAASKKMLHRVRVHVKLLIVASKEVNR